MVTYRAEEKQNDGGQPAEATGNGTPKDAPRRSDGGILGLFGHMARGVEADEDTGRGQV